MEVQKVTNNSGKCPEDGDGKSFRDEDLMQYLKIIKCLFAIIFGLIFLMIATMCWQQFQIIKLQQKVSLCNCQENINYPLEEHKEIESESKVKSSYLRQTQPLLDRIKKRDVLELPATTTEPTLRHHKKWPWGIHLTWRGPKDVDIVHFGIINGKFGGAKGRFIPTEKNGSICNWQVDSKLDELYRGKASYNGDTGKLTVHESGVYLIYSQISYAGEEKSNGYEVVIGKRDGGVRSFMQCYRTYQNKDHNSDDAFLTTCYTSGVTYLDKEDDVFLMNYYKGRILDLRAKASFWGVVRIA